MAAKTLGAWKAVRQEEQVLTDEGNILLPLERVRDRYTKRAAELEENAPGKGASDEKDKVKRIRMLNVAAHYRQAADAVQKLIGVVSCADLVEPPAPVDQTEEILSDDGKQQATDLCGAAAVLAAFAMVAEVPPDYQG